jgi:NTE family protein
VPLDLPRPVAFALGGGAAYGAVQIGMLRARIEAGVRPDMVVGTSVGSINGALLAFDPDGGIDRLTDIWPSISTARVFPGGWLGRLRTLQATKAWLSDNAGIAGILGEHLPARRFADLTLPFGAVTADYVTAEPVVVTSGDLHSAILASAAIPGIFPPVRVGERTLVDGGLLANVPVRQALDMGAASVVVLDCGLWGVTMTNPATLVEVMLRVSAISVGLQLAYELPAVAANVPVVYLPGVFPMTTSPLDFSHWQRLSAGGYVAAKPFLSVLRVDGPGLYGTPPLHLVRR